MLFLTQNNFRIYNIFNYLEFTNIPVSINFHLQRDHARTYLN